MGLPQIDFRVPEATWLKSALSGFSGFFARFGLSDRFGVMPGLRSTGALAWPYKIAVVAVMTLVACGTLVTFGSAGAETPSSSEISALPGSDEASPTVEGQVLPPATSLLNADDLMSTLNLNEYGAGDTSLFTLPDDDDEDSDDDSDDEEADEKAKAAVKKRLAAAKPTPTPTKTTTPTTNPTTPSPTPTKTTPPPSPTPTPAPVCKTVWVKDGSLLGGHFEQQCS